MGSPIFPGIEHIIECGKSRRVHAVVWNPDLRGIESPADDVRHLTMRMTVHRPDGAGVELHGDHHQIGAVSEDLPAHPFPNCLPCGRLRAGESAIGDGR